MDKYTKFIRKVKRILCRHEFKIDTVQHIPHEIRYYKTCKKCGQSICEKQRY